MNAMTQREFHPNAESLSAFAEQALGERERGQVLEHLAVCGRCRHVVALAREAADAEAVATAARRTEIQPDAWWKRWRIVWVPTAVVAAFAAASISVYIRQAAQSERTIKIAEQTATQNVTMASNRPQPEPAKAAAAAPGEVAEVGKGKRAASTTPRARGRGRDVLYVGRPDYFGNMGVPEPPLSKVQEQELAAGLASSEKQSNNAAPPPSAMNGALASKLEAPAEQPARSGAARAVDALAEQKKQIEAEAVERHMFAATASAPASGHGANGPVPRSGAQVTVSAAAPQPETLGALSSSIEALKGRNVGGLSAARMAIAIHLPSGLPAVSMASAGQRMLAIDQAGTLFLSEDQGGTWEPVTRQWTGHAVVVRRQATGSGEAAPASAPETTGNTSADTSAASRPAPVFEILNDQSQIWLSTDGKIWIAK